MTREEFRKRFPLPVTFEWVDAGDGLKRKCVVNVRALRLDAPIEIKGESKTVVAALEI